MGLVKLAYSKRIISSGEAPAWGKVKVGHAVLSKNITPSKRILSPVIVPYLTKDPLAGERILLPGARRTSLVAYGMYTVIFTVFNEFFEDFPLYR